MPVADNLNDERPPTNGRGCLQWFVLALLGLGAVVLALVSAFNAGEVGRVASDGP